MNIAEIIPQDDCVLLIRSDDGRAGYFDVKPYLHSEAFSPLRDAVEFRKVSNGKYFIEWGCGADLSADTIQAKWAEVEGNLHA